MDTKCKNIKDFYYAIILIFRRTKLPKDGLIRHIMEFMMYDELNDQTIKQAVLSYHMLFDMDKLRFKLGPLIKCWNTSKVTSFLFLFKNIDNFHGDLSGWDVSNVETMHGMFYNTHNFNGNLQGWKIPKVECVQNIFVNSDCETVIVSMIEDLGCKILQYENANHCDCAKYNYGFPPIILAQIIQHVTFRYNYDQLDIPTPNIHHVTFGHNYNQSAILTPNI